MSRHNRVAKLESVRRPKPRAACVVVIRNGETGTEAIDRVERETGMKPIRALGVPGMVTDANRAEFERRFYLQQTRSIADAKSARPKEVEQ